MQFSVQKQLARLQRQLSPVATQARERLSGLAAVVLRKSDGAAPAAPEAAAQVKRKSGATPAKGAYVPKAKAVAAKKKKERVAVRRPIPEVVVTEPVEIVPAGVLLKPFLLLSAVVLAVVLSAITVIFSAYEYRQLFHEHQSLIQQRDDLQVEWGQLLLEQSAWAANNRVEVLAIRKLDMLVPDPEQIEIVRRGN